MTEEKIKVNLHDGRVLWFPKGTNPDVIQSTVKNQISQQPDEVSQMVATPSNETPGPSMRAASPSLFQGITDAAGRGFTGGIADPVRALGSATGQVASDFITGQDGPSFGESYDQSINQIRGDEKAFARENPYVGGTAELAGMVANPVMNAAGKYVSQGANIGKRMLRGGFTGAPIMGVYGGSTAAEGAGYGLLAGLAAGTLSIPVIEGAIGLARATTQKIIDKFGGDLTRAGQHVSEIIKEMGGGDLQAGVAIARQKLNEFGEDAVLADVLGEQGVNKASGAALVPGRPRQVADDFVNARRQGRPERLHKAADEIADRDFYPKIESTKASMRASAKPLYDEAFAPVSDAEGRVYAQWDQRLENLLQSPDIKKAMAVGIENEKRSALAANRDFSFEEYAVKGFDENGALIFDGTPNLRSMDAAKRGLDSLINKHRDNLTGKINWDGAPELRSLDELRKSLVTKLDEITTVNGRSAYAEARKSWAGPATEMDSMWMGRRFKKGDEEVSKAAFDKLSPENQEMFLLGVRREVTKDINADTQTAVNKFAEKKADLWIRFENILPADKFKAFKSSIEKELKKAENEATINPKYGSPTEKNRQNVEDLSRAPGFIADALESAKGGVPGMIGALGRGSANWLKSPNRKMANDLVDTLLEMNPAKQSQILDLIGDRALVQNYVPLLAPETARKLSAFMATKAPSMVRALSKDMTETDSTVGTKMELTPMQNALGAK